MKDAFLGFPAAVGGRGRKEGRTTYADFFAAFGLVIAEDRDGDSRPQDTTWDIGADEYTE